MTEVEMCTAPGCVLAADHPEGHAPYRVSMFACPHNIPNFMVCKVCD